MKITSMKNRLLSLALCLCMVLSLLPGLPVTVSAVGASKPVVSGNNIYANGTPLYIVAGTSSGTAIYYLNGSQKVYLNSNGAAGNDLSDTIVRGGYLENALDGDVNITMTGGKISRISGTGFDYYNSKGGYVNNVNITISGGTVTEEVAAGYMNPVNGNVNITVTGGSVNRLYGCCSVTQATVGNADVKVKGNVNIIVTGGSVTEIHGGDGYSPISGTVSGIVAVPTTFKNYTSYGGDLTRNFHNILYLNGSSYVYRGQVTIPSGVTLTVAAGQSLTINSGQTLINNGTLVNNGTITVSGVLRNNGTFVNNGTVNRNAAYITTSASGTPSVWVNGSAVSGLVTEYADGKLYIFGVTGSIKATLNGKTYYGYQKGGTATELTSSYVGVTDLSGFTTQMNAYQAVTLQAAISPENTTLPQTITYEVVDAGGTGATVSGNVLNAYGAGTVKLRAKATDGYFTYTEDFSVTVSFVPVTGLSKAVPSTMGLGINILPGVAPSNASNKTVVWSVVSAGNTGATITGNQLTISNKGTLKIKCLVENGVAYGRDYTQEFTITAVALDYVNISAGSVTISKKDDQTLTVTHAGFDGGSKDYGVNGIIPITGTTTANTVTVASGNPRIQITDLSIDVSDTLESCAFSINSGANVTLILSGINVLKSGGGEKKVDNTVFSVCTAGLRVPSGAAVTIEGTGQLTACGKNCIDTLACGAGIGGSVRESAGTITIDGGTVIATGGHQGGAGIGGGWRGDGGTVKITGGNVKATGGLDAAAIGSGRGGSSNGTLTDGNGNSVSKVTLTLNGAAADTAVSAVSGMTYGVNGVKTLDTNKLYFYLPSGAEAVTITAGGEEYVCNRNLTYYKEHEFICESAKDCAGCGYTTGEHNFANGVCTTCGLCEDGAYNISTSKQLMNFARLVNAGVKDANAILMADIDLTGYEWTTICETGLYYGGYGKDLGYSGTFDGNGHIIKNITATSSTTKDASCGLFGTVSGTIKNLGIEGFTFVDGGKDIRAGAIVGQLITANGKVSNCYVKGATITPGEHVTGGIAGCVYDGTIENCYVVESTITGTSGRFGYIVGDSRGDGGESDRPGTVINCYCGNKTILSERVGNVTNCETKSTKAFASGEVTYLLNGSKSNGDLIWYQTIGTDAVPKFAGGTVYKVSCVGAECYSNENKHYDTHNFVDGICSQCGALTPADNNNGIYVISNVTQYMWFAEFVNAGNTAANAKLMADIDLSKHGNVMIGTSSAKYSGNFDGNGKKLTVSFDTTEEYIAPFRYIDGATIQNLTVDGTIATNAKFAAGLVGRSDGTSKIEKCMVGVTINSGVSGDGTHGGLVAHIESGSMTIDNCGFIGSITGNATHSCGGFVGWANGKATIKNSYMCGTFTTGTSDCYIFGRNPGNITVSNSYYKEAYGTNNSGATQKSAEQFASGEVTYLLNGSKSDGELVWYQTLGTDAYPQFAGDIVLYTEAKGYYNHLHQWQYVAEGSTINVTCENADGDCSGPNAGTVTVYPPVNNLFTGEPIEAQVLSTLTNGDTFTVVYSGENLVDGKPVYFGSYTATVTLGGQTVQVAYAIDCNHEQWNYSVNEDGHLKYCACGYSQQETHSYNDQAECICGNICSHTGGTATCAKLAVCEDCGMEYGSLNADNHADNTNTKITDNGDDTHSLICSECNTAITTDDHKGGEATCTKLAVCEDCGVEYGYTDCYNHVGETYAEYAWYPYDDGTCYVNADLYCADCGGWIDYISDYAEQTGSVEAIDCQNPGSVTYSITLTLNGQEYTASKTFEVKSHNHVGHFEKGFCSACGGYQMPELDLGEDPEWEYDDVYLVYNAGQLFWVADYVNNVSNEIKVKLMDDIAIPEGKEWTPIMDFYSTFDGNFKTVSGLYVKSEGNEIGMFGGGGYSYGTVKNLNLSNSYFEGNQYVGGLAGYYAGTIENCSVDGTVTVVGDSYVGALVGSFAGYMYNCFAYAPTLVGSYNSSYSTIENSYYLSETDDGNGGKTAEQFASGEVAFLLQSGILGEDIWDDETGEWIGTADPELIWGQTIGQDAYPVLKGAKVYQITDCQGNTGYSNTETMGHVEVVITGKAPTCTEPGLTDGVKCSVCGEILTAQEEIPAGHKLTQVEAQAPTCTEAGWDAYEYCTECDYTTKVEIPAGHKLTQVEAQAPTCTEAGWEAYEYCTECDYTTKVEIPAGHKLTQVEAQAPTCTEAGWEAYEYCTECDYTTKVEIPAGHKLTQVEAQAPTCTEAGWDAYEYCTECDYTTKVEIPATGNHVDADNSGRCDTCNCLMQPAKLVMTSVSLKGNIGVNYYMLLSDEVLADSTAYMQFILADGEIIKIPVSEGVQMVRDGETYYVYSCNVDAKEMTDDIISQFFYDGGVSREHTYNVQTYAKHILQNYDDEATKNLITSMLNYGSASQLHFGYNTDKLANAEMETPDYSGVTIEGFNATAGQGTELAKFYSASLILKSETTLRFFFTGAITATYNGQELEVKERGGLYYVDVVGISAKDLDEDVTITINDGTNTADVTFNPMSYCQGVLNDTTGAFDQEMKDLVAALYLYNQAANTYFKEN